MGVRARIPVAQGKTIDWMEKRVSKHGDQYTDFIQIRFTDGTIIELSAVAMSDRSNQIAIEHFEK
jgi:hypothetical protein